MLAALGYSSMPELFHAVPAELMLETLRIPEGKSELETHREMERLAAQNHIFSAYLPRRRRIPPLSRRLSNRSLPRKNFDRLYALSSAEISNGRFTGYF